MTGIMTGLHNFVNFPFKGGEQYLNELLNELSDIDTKKSIRIMRRFFLIDAWFDMIGRNISFRNNSKKNETKDIIKVIRSLENRRILLKRTTRKITGEKRGFFNFLRLLMTAGLSLMKSVLNPLVASVLIPLG